ncbi:MAG: mannonate dehydratase [Brotaphodocola sp.]
MQLSFRWRGEDDAENWKSIRQISGVRASAAALYDAPVGEVWEIANIWRLKEQIEKSGLEFDVIEDIPVHEDIKMGRPERDRYIENYCENIRRVAACGVKCIGYEFIPDFHEVDERKRAMSVYRLVQEETIWKNLQYFLKRIIPVAAECNVNMAIRADIQEQENYDIVRFLASEENLDRVLQMMDDPHHGLTFCTDTYGCLDEEDLAKLAAKYAQMGRIHFVHLHSGINAGERDEKQYPLSDRAFWDKDMTMKALHDHGFHGYIGMDGEIFA